MKLNQVYLGYDRCTSNYNSTSSMIKLPFKSFSTMKVPDCFARSYEHERKELIQTDASEADHEDSHEKKLWKEHK